MAHSYQNYKVVACIPCGRRRNLEILLPYLLRERDVIDEVNFWINTNNIDDIEYIYKASWQYPEYFKCVEMPNKNARKHLIGTNAGVSAFYPHCVEKGTIYIKCDDDICYIEPRALEALVAFRLKNRDPLLVYPNTINNTMMNHIHQRLGCIPLSVGKCRWHAECSIGYKCGKAAQVFHNSFIKNHKAKTLESYKFYKYLLWDYPRVSIGFILFFGDDLSEFVGGIHGNDEVFLSMTLPARLGRPNLISGKEIVCHFSYKTQRDYLESNTNLLLTYKQIMTDELQGSIVDLSR